MAFPKPDEEHRPISSHSILITHATRIVLLSLQMLFLAHYRDSRADVEYAWHGNFDYERLPLHLLLRTFHFERSRESSQLLFHSFG